MDGFALPVKKLKGTDPVETLDLSRKGLREPSAIMIASLIGVNASLTKIECVPKIKFCSTLLHLLPKVAMIPFRAP